jgi:hypothetical protein
MAPEKLRILRREYWQLRQSTYSLAVDLSLRETYRLRQGPNSEKVQVFVLPWKNGSVKFGILQLAHCSTTRQLCKTKSHLNNHKLIGTPLRCTSVWYKFLPPKHRYYGEEWQECLLQLILLTECFVGGKCVLWRDRSSKESEQVRSSLELFVTSLFLKVRAC